MRICYEPRRRGEVSKRYVTAAKQANKMQENTKDLLLELRSSSSGAVYELQFMRHSEKQKDHVRSTMGRSFYLSAANSVPMTTRMTLRLFTALPVRTRRLVLSIFSTTRRFRNHGNVITVGSTRAPG